MKTTLAFILFGLTALFARAQDTIVKDTIWITPRRTSATGPMDASGILKPLDGYRITDVKFQCANITSENACAWNYNPNGGYGGNIVLNPGDGSATWRRRYGGNSCKQIYTITYSKVIIENFWKDKLTFMTDAEYNPDSKVFLKNTASIPVKLRYRVQYNTGKIVANSIQTTNVPAYGNIFVGAKYIRTSDGLFIINYELYEVPAP